MLDGTILAFCHQDLDDLVLFPKKNLESMFFYSFKGTLNLYLFVYTSFVYKTIAAKLGV